MRANLCIVSGGDRIRLASPVNHKIYARMHGVDFRHENGPYGQLKNPYFLKLAAIIEVLPRYEFVLWIDSDAYFTDFDRNISALSDAMPEAALILLADGRVRPGGPFTMINTGVMLVRNRPETFAFLSQCLDTEIETVKQWWRPEAYGMFTHSDQDVVLYRHLTGGDRQRIFTAPHLTMNARQYHYGASLNEHFIVHFAGIPDRARVVKAFGARFGVGASLVPPALLQAHGSPLNIGDDFLPPVTLNSVMNLARGKLKRAASAIVARAR